MKVEMNVNKFTILVHTNSFQSHAELPHYATTKSHFLC